MPRCFNLVLIKALWCLVLRYRSRAHRDTGIIPPVGFRTNLDTPHESCESMPSGEAVDLCSCPTPWRCQSKFSSTPSSGFPNDVVPSLVQSRHVTAWLVECWASEVGRDGGTSSSEPPLSNARIVWISYRAASLNQAATNVGSTRSSGSSLRLQPPKMGDGSRQYFDNSTAPGRD